MSFKYSVICDNTQENREWLKKLKDKTITWVSKDFELILSWENDIFFCDNKDIPDCLRGVSYINCIGNPQLFQAVSAIRKGTDINQLFVDEMLELLTGEINLIMCERDDKKYLEVYTTLRKATLTELQERFKLN